MIPELTIDVVRRDDLTTVALAGEIDTVAAPRLREALTKACSEEGSIVVVDLGEVTFMDSTGLSALVLAHRLSCESKGELIVTRASAAVRRVLDISGFTQVLSITD